MKGMLFIGLMYCFFLLNSCEWSTKPYLEYDVEVEKISESCSGQTGSFRMISNTNGERYIIRECLAVDFKKENLLVERKGDTVNIHYKTKASSAALFQLTIDIDTYPRYNFLTIGTTTYRVVQGRY